MKKAIFILLSACLICACGQKGPLVPAEAGPPATIISERAMSEILTTFSSQF